MGSAAGRRLPAALRNFLARSPLDQEGNAMRLRRVTAIAAVAAAAAVTLTAAVSPAAPPDPPVSLPALPPPPPGSPPPPPPAGAGRALRRQRPGGRHSRPGRRPVGKPGPGPHAD